jgi:hypothetical protein
MIMLFLEIGMFEKLLLLVIFKHLYLTLKLRNLKIFLKKLTR